MTDESGETTPGAGWASATLDRALWEASAAGLGAWQLFIGTLVAVRTPEAPLLVLAAHATVGLLAAASLRRDLPRAVFFTALFAVLSLDLLLADGPLLTAAICMSFIVTATPFLVMPTRSALAVTSAGTITGAGCAALGGGTSVALAITASTVLYSLAAMRVMRSLRGFARVMDAEVREAAIEHDRYVTARAAARTASEHARTLHDTLVNTLGVVAAARGDLLDAADVRSRCRSDLAAFDALITSGTATSIGLDEIDMRSRIDIVRTGLARATGDEEIPISEDRRDALRGITRELVLNAEKHAQVDRVHVDAALDGDDLIVTVADHGVGFDPDSVAPRGLATSIRGRADEAGIGVELVTAVGHGTQVTLRCPLQPAEGGAETSETDLERVARRLTWEGCWGWCAGVIVAGFAVSAIGAAPLPLLASTVLVGMLTALAWICCRDGDESPRLLAVALALGVPVGFGLSFTGVYAAGGRPEFWTGIGLTPLLVILLVVIRSPVLVVLGGGGLVAAAMATAAVTWGDDSTLAAIAIVNSSVQLAQLGVWVIFARVFGTITWRAAAARRQAADDRAARASIASAKATQARWRDGRVQAGLELLREIADGVSSPVDPAVRRRAHEEEHALRQLLQLSPDLVHLGPWLARAIGHGRDVGVRLVMRVGDTDVPDAASAAELGQHLTTLLDGTSPGTELTVGYFGHLPDACLTVVGPAGFTGPSDDPQVRVVTLFDQDLVEIRATVDTRLGNIEPGVDVETDGTGTPLAPLSG